MDFCRAAPFGLDTGAGKPLSLLLIAGRSRFWFGYMNFPFLCRLLRGESPSPAFGRNIKSARYRYGFLQGSPFSLDIIALPFGQAWRQIPIPAGRCRVKRKSPPAFCGMPHIFRLHQSRSRAGAGLLQGAGRCRGRAPQAFRPAGETDGKAVEPAPLRGAGCLRRPRRVCTRPGSQPLPQQPQKLRLFHPAQGTVPDPVRQHHRQLLALPLFIRP